MTADGPRCAFSTKRLKYLVSLRRSRTNGACGDRPYVGLENIESWSGRLVSRSPETDPSAPQATSEGESLTTTFEVGDVLFCKLRPYLAKVWVAEFPGRATTELLVMQPRGFIAPFLRYVCLHRGFIDAVDASTFGSKMPRADWEFIGNVPVAVPEVEIQCSIATFLDRETGRIDSLIAAKQHLLRLLAEKRKAIVASAVTRGLDPAAAPTRDSGVPWLGEVPAHWEMWKLGHLGRVGNGSTPNRDNSEYWSGGTIPWLNSAVVNQYEVTSADQFVTDLAFRECHLPLVRPGSVLVAITGQGKTRGQAVVLSIRATINQHLAFIEPDSARLDPWFLRWMLFAAYEYLRSISDDAGGTKGALTCEEVAGLRIPVPPLAEQRSVVEFIACETAKLEEVRVVTEGTIALLKERRSALIAAAVTGQIDVTALA